MKRRAAILITRLTALWFAVFLYPAWMVVKQAFEGPPGGFTLAYLGAVFQSALSGGPVERVALGCGTTVAAL